VDPKTLRVYGVVFVVAVLLLVQAFHRMPWWIWAPALILIVAILNWKVLRHLLRTARAKHR
jgi:hypothetical protein